MAAMFLAKRGFLNIHKASSIHKDYNNTARSLADGVNIITSSRYFSSHGNNEREESKKKEGMGTTTDGKAPNVTMSHAADTSREGLKQAINIANEESGDASKSKSVDNGEENEHVVEDGTNKGENHSSG